MQTCIYLCARRSLNDKRKKDAPLIDKHYGRIIANMSNRSADALVHSAHAKVFVVLAPTARPLRGDDMVVRATVGEIEVILVGNIRTLRSISNFRVIPFQ